MLDDSGLTVKRAPPAPNPNGKDGYALPSFPEAMQERLVQQNREQTEQLNKKLQGDGREEKFAAPPGYDARMDHFTNFFDYVRHSKPVVEDAVFGLRAAGPALLTTRSYFVSRPFTWDPERMKVGKN